MNAPPEPQAPLLAARDLPAVGGRIGPEPEDFIVDEEPLYPASGDGEHLYVRFRKRRFTTRDALRRIATAAGVPIREIGSAGMKDKHAVTSQWISMPARRAAAPDTWALPDGITVLETARHTNKLRTGHLLGNTFGIRLVGVDGSARDRAVAVFAALGERGVPNAFGAQRFGRGGRNLGDALGWLAEVAEDPRRSRRPPFEQKLFASVVQSEIFNRYLTLRREAGLERPLSGEVVRLAGTGSSFVVEDPERELPRWTTRDVLPMGPMLGPKAKAAQSEALALEARAIAEVGLTDGARTALARHADGTRRDLLVFPERVEVSASAPDALVVTFFLPSGSYATGVIRELTRGPFLSEDHERDA